jgi:hypothetical protein
MRFYLIPLLLFLSVCRVDAQHLTRRQADSLLILVPRFTPGITESGDCLRLAQFFIEKEGSKKPDLDSASFFINKAKTLSPAKYSAKIQGYILLEQSFLSDESGNQRATISFASKAIPILKKGGDSVLLGKAYYELSRCYPDYHDNALLAKRVLLVDSAVRYLIHSPDQEELAADLLMLGDLYGIQDNDIRSFEAMKKRRVRIFCLVKDMRIMQITTMHLVTDYWHCRLAK